MPLVSKLIIIFDPSNRAEGFKADQAISLGIKQVELSISDELENIDIYNIAKKLAELLLEQL